MVQPFYNRLKDYYMKVGSVLRGEAEVASIFPNTTDKGMSREKVYAEFLRLHLPSSCNVLFGGFLFNLAGAESKQIDLIITNDVCPQYNFHNKDGNGKTFACIEGALAVASIKSSLDSKELRDSLDNLASLPSKNDLGSKALPLLPELNYDDWPYKIIYASDGVSLQTVHQTLDSYYNTHVDIPINSRPNLIHVAGKYNLVRVPPTGGTTRNGTVIPGNTFYPHTDTTDVFALLDVVQSIQKYNALSRYVLFTYDQILENISFA